MDPESGSSRSLGYPLDERQESALRWFRAAAADKRILALLQVADHSVVRARDLYRDEDREIGEERAARILSRLRRHHDLLHDIIMPKLREEAGDEADAALEDADFIAALAAFDADEPDDDLLGILREALRGDEPADI